MNGRETNKILAETLMFANVFNFKERDSGVIVNSLIKITEYSQ